MKHQKWDWARHVPRLMDELWSYSIVKYTGADWKITAKDKLENCWWRKEEEEEEREKINHLLTAKRNTKNSKNRIHQKCENRQTKAI